MQFIGVLENVDAGQGDVRLIEADDVEAAKAKLIPSYINDYGAAESEDEDGPYTLEQPDGWLTIYQVIGALDNDGVAQTILVWQSE